MLKHRPSHSGGFSLTELLVVIAVIGILSSLSWTVLTAVATSNNVALTCANISQLLDLARGQAMADATYVFVGFEEVDNSLSSTPATATTGGKVVVLVVASQNGTNNYLSGAWQTTGNFVALSKPTYFPNVHLADFSALTAASGPMASRISPIASVNSLGNSAANSSIVLFYWPLSATSASSAQYSFSKVIQFDPHGVASVQLNNSTPNPGWLEIGLQAIHGDIIPPAPTQLTTGQIASVQIDGITGVNQIFRP